MNNVLLKWPAIIFFIAAFLPSFGQTNFKNVAPGVTNDSSKNVIAAKSNDVITRNDETNIKWKAENVVKRFMRVLNVLATGLYSEIPESEKIIRNSYAQPVSKIFNDSTVIIVDDLRQGASNKTAKDKPAFDYLKDFDLLYEKSETESVAFSNFKVSNIKKANYLYIKVYFDCLFKNKSKISEVPYTLTSKVAELKLEKQNNKWNAWIVDIHFLDSTDISHADKNDIVIAENIGTAVTELTSVLAEENPAEKQVSAPVDPAEKERIRKQNDSIRTYMAFKNLKDSGDHSFNRQQFVMAYQFYNEADIMISHAGTAVNQSSKDYLETMIRQTRKNIAVSDRSPDEQYGQYIQQAVLARGQRRYDDAVDFYNKALLIKPDDEAIKAKKRELTTWVNNLSRLDAKYKAGKYKDAIEDYDNAIKTDPKNSDYYLGRGKCFEKTKDLKKAMNDYKKAIELDENNLQAFFVKGELHEKQGSYADALAAFTVCATNDKSNIASYLKMADMNVAINNLNAAVNALDKGISNNENGAALYHRKGELLYQQKKMADAQENFSRAIYFDSSNGNYFYHRGLCELELKKVSQAGEDFVKAKKLGLDAAVNTNIQQMADAFYNDGVAKFNAGKPDLALVVINYAVAIDPAKDQYRFQRAECYLQLKDYSNAVTGYSEAIQLNRDNFDAYKQRGISKLYQKQYKDAITDFEAAIKINPRTAEVYKSLGDTYLEMKDYNKAVNNYDAALSAPKSAKKTLDDDFFAALYNNRGEAYYYLDKLPLAMQSFKNAIENDKKNGAAYFNRGRTYLKLKELNNAEDDFKRALDQDAKNPLWNFKLGELYQVKEKFDKAINQYNISIAMDSSRVLSYDPVYYRAVCNVMLTNYSDALKDYTTIQNKNAQAAYPAYHTELGNLYLEVNQPDSALKHFNISNADASDPFPMYGKAVAYVQKKQIDEAFSWLEKSFALNKLPKGIVTRDKKLAAIKDDKRYKTLMKKYF